MSEGWTFFGAREAQDATAACPGSKSRLSGTKFTFLEMPRCCCLKDKQAVFLLPLSVVDRCTREGLAKHRISALYANNVTPLLTMLSTISLTEYKMRHPDTAEFPTLSQNGALAALLQKRRFKAARLALGQAKRQARRHAMRAWWKRWRAKLRRPASRPAEPTFARVARQS